MPLQHFSKLVGGGGGGGVTNCQTSIYILDELLLSVTAICNSIVKQIWNDACRETVSFLPLKSLVSQNVGPAEALCSSMITMFTYL